MQGIRTRKKIAWALYKIADAFNFADRLLFSIAEYLDTGYWYFHKRNHTLAEARRMPRQ